jgi:N-acetylmuramoyl-L-alanine amidase
VLGGVGLLAGALPEQAAAAPWLLVIDPGHGGIHDGAVGPTGAKEKDLALQVAKQVAALAEAQLPVKTLLTREGDRDVQLEDRVAFANRKKASLFISIHLNSMPTDESRRLVKGVETYFLSADPSDASAEAQAARENLDELATRSPGKRRDVDRILNDLALTAAQADSSRLAYAIHEQLVAATGDVDRGIHQAPFYVLTGARMPAVLLELGFISNPEEEQKLRTPAYQRVLAQAIVDGIKEYRKVVGGHAGAKG